ncbi:MAG: thiolase family protein, partial [Myxococcales bacterium]
MDAVIIDAVRTPVGKLRGALSAVRPDDLGAHVIEQLLRRNPGAQPGSIDEVFFGCANQAGEDNRNVARMALLLAGLPEQVPGVTLNRLCASGLEAAVQASRAIRLGDMELCIAGGVESMTRAPWAVMKPADGFPGGALQSYDTALGWRFPNPRMSQRFPLESMGETAENVAVHYRIPREKQDEFALRSHQKALAAQESGRYRAELLPVTVPGKQPVTVDRDEGPRADTSLEKLAKLKPAFDRTTGHGTLTAGNSSPLTDGASSIWVASDAGLARLPSTTPRVKLVDWEMASVDFRVEGLLMAPPYAIPRLLQRNSLTYADIDLWEIHEAFAAQVLAHIKALESGEFIRTKAGVAGALGAFPRERLNPNGGSV